MIKNKLNIGDYIFTSYGELYRITKINKRTYSAKDTRFNWTIQIPFNGVRVSEEFFECDEPQPKALELAFKRYDRDNRIIEEGDKAKKLIGKAKYFLQHVEDFLDEIDDIEEIEPEVNFK